MTELRRWSEEGATAAELSLLEISRREQAPARARAQALAALGLVATASTVLGAASTAAASARSTALLLKLLSIPVLGAGLVAGGLAVEHAHQVRVAAAEATLALSARALTAPRVSAPPPPVSSEPMASASAPSTAVSSAPPAAPARVSRPERASGRLSQEVRALELVQTALAGHNASSVLRQLDHYSADFPGGALSSEATVLRVRALLMNGNRAGARKLADSYSSAHPDSPYARRIQDILRNGH